MEFTSDILYWNDEEEHGSVFRPQVFLLLFEHVAWGAPVRNGVLWKTADTVEFIAGRITNWVKSYSGNVVPEFFGKLVEYSERYKYAWHTPGHLGDKVFSVLPQEWRHTNFSEKIISAVTFQFPFRNWASAVFGDKAYNL